MSIQVKKNLQGCGVGHLEHEYFSKEASKAAVTMQAETASHEGQLEG